ncbi:MAG: hypothetical protein Q4G21_09750 [Dermabacter sp.]|nr:hypothetical protein [Dermabacter sp.]
MLTGQLDDALVLAFITGGVPSYLELAPLDDSTVYTEFPEASALSFAPAAPSAAEGEPRAEEVN